MIEPTVRTRTVQDFVLREASYLPGFAGTEHRHALPYFGSVIEGAFVERSPRGRVRYGRGSLHFHPAGDPHSGIVGGEGARCFSILPGERLAGRLDAAGDPPLAPRLASLAARCHRGFRANDLASDLECESSALELVAAVLRWRVPREAVPTWLPAVRDRLHACAGESVTLAALAQVAGVHPVHVARVFRRKLGLTPAAYLRRLRFEQACRALAESDLPLADVALETGYANQSHLTRDFRARLDTTPTAYRRARRTG
jgi:AraC family transcriptional regulator